MEIVVQFADNGPPSSISFKRQAFHAEFINLFLLFSSKMVWEKETRVTASSSFGSQILVFRFECCYCITPPPKTNNHRSRSLSSCTFFARKLFQFLLAYHEFPHLGFVFFAMLTDRLSNPPLCCPSVN